MSKLPHVFLGFLISTLSIDEAILFPYAYSQDATKTFTIAKKSPLKHSLKGGFATTVRLHANRLKQAI